MRNAGVSLIELMVGLLIALVATVAILRTFAASESFKRDAIGVADAQETGLLSLQTLAAEIANAGAGIAMAARELGSCPDTGDIRTSMRPLPVLITPGADASHPDSVVVTYATATAHGASIAFAADAPAGAVYRVKSPFGLRPEDSIVASSLAGQCAMTTVTAVSASDSEGVVEVAHTGAAASFPATSRLVNLGPRGRAVRARYDVSDNALRSLDLLVAGASPNPLASNVVNMKAQYGVDTDDDGFLDAWVSATAAPWDPTSLMAAPVATIGRIKAIRIGVIVRSEIVDREPTLRSNWVLFDCSATDKTQCPGRLAGTVPAGWRYRTHETVIPLRNAIWNPVP